MHKVNIIIGQSCSGKTTYIRNNFIKDYEDIQFTDKPFKMTALLKNKEKWVLLGHYKGEKRCEGSDELSMAILPQLIDHISEGKNDFDVLIADGDRINNERFFKFIKGLNVQTTLYVLTCSLEMSLKRRKETGSNPSEKFVKGTITKSNNMKKLGRQLGFNIKVINTDDKKQTTLMDFIGD